MLTPTLRPPRTQFVKKKHTASGSVPPPPAKPPVTPRIAVETGPPKSTVTKRTNIKVVPTTARVRKMGNADLFAPVPRHQPRIDQINDYFDMLNLHALETETTTTASPALQASVAATPAHTRATRNNSLQPWDRVVVGVPRSK